MVKFLYAILITCIICSCTKEDLTPGGGDGGEIDEAILLDCTHTADITLTDHNSDGIDYIVEYDMVIRDGVFSIDPGTTIQFSEGASITAQTNGILRTLGTSGSPILMTGVDQGRASWRGVYIYSDKGSNQFEHVIIEDAGDGEEFGISNNNHGAITLHGRLSMKNCTIKNSGSNGIISLENVLIGKIDAFENNTITGCEQYPLLIKQDHVANMDLKSCTLTENGINMVGLHQDNSDRLNQKATFEALDIPYFIEDGFELYAPLTIEAGAEVVMGNGSFLNSTRDNNQYPLIQETQSNHVTIRGNEALSGYWEGIYLTEANVQKIWEYLDLSDGGSVVQGKGSLAGNVTVAREANLTINNCTSSRSGVGCDIVLHDFIETPTLVDNSPHVSYICEE
jgi:hypothetical protein